MEAILGLAENRVPLLLHSPLIWSINSGFLHNCYIFLPCSRFLVKECCRNCAVMQINLNEFIFRGQLPIFGLCCDYFNALCSSSVTADSGSSRDPLCTADRAQLSLVPSFAGLPPAASPRCQMRCYDRLHSPLPQCPQTGVPFTAT